MSKTQPDLGVCRLCGDTPELQEAAKGEVTVRHDCPKLPGSPRVLFSLAEHGTWCEKCSDACRPRSAKDK
jgi:hypothetical protein